MKWVEAEDSPLGSNDVRHEPTEPSLPFTLFAAPRLYRFALPSTRRKLQNSCRIRLRPSRKRAPHDNCCLAQTFLRTHWSISYPERGDWLIFQSDGEKWPDNWRISEASIMDWRARETTKKKCKNLKSLVTSSNTRGVQIHRMTSGLRVLWSWNLWSCSLASRSSFYKLKSMEGSLSTTSPAPAAALRDHLPWLSSITQLRRYEPCANKLHLDDMQCKPTTCRITGVNTYLSHLCHSEWDLAVDTIQELTYLEGILPHRKFMAMCGAL